MKTTIYERLLHRSIGERSGSRKTGVRDFYGDRVWMDEMDIVNELGGHTGCVNALSWSRSGRLLASGSDDTYLNIWSYNPDSLAKPFSLATAVSTGHRANIFSVKFAPHSNDRTVITCAGDAEVRVFDIEYGGNFGNTAGESTMLDSTRSRRYQNFFSNARFLSSGNTNARVYRSHGDRVKRIVTESSPYTFLTCSEDGEVRQWDLRQPSSAYPAPRGGQGFRNLRPGQHHDADNVPPPLISYKKYSLDLNSISCSPNQPYYIALAGAHLHCFLHDRRMLGRDVALERGSPTLSSPVPGSHDDHMMDQATRCVRRFAPNDQFAMGTHNDSHITGCKISDANPNELIASWSGDHIYSFDLVQSPDVRDASREKERRLRQNHEKSRRREDYKRKRKRAEVASSTNLSEEARSKTRSPQRTQNRQGETSVMVRYGNGQAETIAMDEDEAMADHVSRPPLSEAQRLSQRIARSLVQLRKSIFDFEASAYDAVAADGPRGNAPHTAAFTTVLGQAAALLPQIDDVIRDWSYYVGPSPEEARLQMTLRRNRQASWRFVQASGCLAAALGGRLQTLGPMPDPRLSMFQRIEPAQREGIAISDRERFCYDFLKAILVWLICGPEAVAAAFRRQPDCFKDSPRFPLEAEDGPEAMDSKLVPYLLHLAREDRPILNVDANRFETEESRTIFGSQSAAVVAFSRAVREVQLSDQPTDSTFASSQADSGAARRFWGIKVGRSVLMEAGEGVNYEFVNRAFGGFRISIRDDIPADRDEDIGDEDGPAEAVDNDSRYLNFDTAEASDEHPASGRLLQTGPGSPEIVLQNGSGSTNQTVVVPESGIAAIGDEQTHDGNDDQDNNDDEDGDEDYDGANGSTSEAEDSDTENAGFGHPLPRRRMGFGGSKERAKAEIDTPYSSHTRVYRGHANLETVKDCGFSGLNDEYVVSGSDCSHVFVWDRKTAELVNILQGDSEVVNVVEAHPHEPMLAVSGLDNTVKIFSPDARLQHDARRGINIAKPHDGASSSMPAGLAFSRAVRRRSSPPPPPPPQPPAVAPGEQQQHRQNQQQQPEDQNDSADTPPETSSPPPGALTSKKAMHRRDEITSQNDVQRHDGVSEAFATRGVLARLAARIHAQGNAQETVVIDDQCLVM